MTEDQQERAAIMEYCGGVPKEQAEYYALDPIGIDCAEKMAECLRRLYGTAQL